MADTDVDTQQQMSMEIEGDLAILTISNPPMNVLSMTMVEQFSAICDDLERKTDVHAVLLQSALEGVFVAGADITMFAELTPELIARFATINQLFDRFAKLPQPTVGALSGTTLGGGFELALACDFRIMAEGFGEIGCPEVRLGILPGGGGTQRLPRLVGQARATEMLLKGMRYDPQTALTLGLVHKLVPADQLAVEARKYAQSLARQAPLAVQAIKRLIRASYEIPASDGLALEGELFADMLRSADAQEGVSAFFEGRKPAFQGR